MKVRNKQTKESPKPIEAPKPLGGTVNKVMVNIGLTLNMGNYSSLKIDGGMTVPVNASVSEMNDAMKTWKQACEVIKETLQKEIPQAKEDFISHFGNGE